jgi:K(+)-stimulated pyrophosphate-energized sodium pump
MKEKHSTPARSLGIVAMLLLALIVSALATAPDALAATAPGTAGTGQHAGGGEAALIVPDLGSVAVGGMNGRTLLMAGLVVCALGLLFGVVIFAQLRSLPVHASMREMSELIYETCKTYLITQGKFLLILEAFIGVIIVLYFGVLLKFDTANSTLIDTNDPEFPHLTIPVTASVEDSW